MLRCGAKIVNHTLVFVYGAGWMGKASLTMPGVDASTTRIAALAIKNEDLLSQLRTQCPSFKH
jgi:hypothetical protein